MGLIKREVRKRIARPARKAAKQAVKRWCPECAKNMPPFHVCVIRTDFKRRKKQADRRAAGQRRKTSARPAHPYQDCRDQECKRAACVAFKQGYESGIQNCPGPHI